MPSWETIRALEAGDWAVLLRCLWLIPKVELSVRWLSPRRWLPPPALADVPGAEGTSSCPAAERIARLVDAVYRRSPWEPTCLTRSLVVYRLLRARGIPCQLRIGLRKNQAALEGHAWTEAGGSAPDAAGYEVVLSF